MVNENNPRDRQKDEAFVASLEDESRRHKDRQWEGGFGECLREVFAQDPHRYARTSHQYVWDMIRWHGSDVDEDRPGITRYELFADELFGMDEALERVANHFKAASEGSEAGRRLLLLLGPPSGGKSSLLTLLKRGLEAYSLADDGAMYAIKDSPIHENPLLHRESA